MHAACPVSPVPLNVLALSKPKLVLSDVMYAEIELKEPVVL